MCGIAGFLGDFPARILRPMAASLAHRGPDGEGFWCDEAAGVGLAHRRLAIIDLSDAAAQPMASCGGRYQIILNGEIYNYRALAAELISHGYEFNEASDTAVLGPLYDLYGADMLSRLNGIFAFALWDTHARNLLLARDRFGVKPLYYCFTPRGLVFASESKALLGVPGLSPELDAKAARDYLVHLWSPGERTLLRDVKKLRPGWLMSATRGSARILQWASPPIGGATSDEAPPHELIGELEELFDNVVADQCVSDAPVGAFLSGGVDSTAIVGAMKATGHAPERVYCLGFSDTSMAADGFEDDLRYARLAADALGVRLTPVMTEAPAPHAFERLAYLLDEPTADPAPLYVEAIAAAARAHGVKVLMSGVGGDDIFSGYRRHVAAAIRTRAGRMGRAVGKAFMGPPRGGPSLVRRASRLSRLLADSEEGFLISAFEFNAPELAVPCLSAHVRAEIDGSVPNALECALAASRGAPLLERLLYLERFGFLPDHNLNYTDKAAMAQGVEVRTPFLDPRLEAFAARVPSRLKVNGFAAKWLLKRALARRAPKPILTRRKTGFGGPVRAWVRGPLQPMLADVFASRAFRQRGLFDPVAVDGMMRDTLSGARDGAYLLLALAMMEFWLRYANEVMSSAPVPA